MKNLLLFTALTLLLSACFDPEVKYPEGDVIGFKPVYVSEVDKTISLEEAREPVSTGKIFLQGDLLLLSEVNEGVHIIDNTDPTNPVNLAFLVVKGNSDMSFKDNLLYVNQFTDIVAIDFSDLENVREVSRQAEAFSLSSSSQLVPPQSGYYFECADPQKGPVLDWQLTTIVDPKCYR